jgi:hypothetical protein
MIWKETTTDDVENIPDLQYIHSMSASPYNYKYSKVQYCL